MTIVYSDDSGPIIWPEDDLHDPNSEKDYYISYRPPVRQSSHAYVKGVDVVIPVTDNGCMYECVSGGISAASPPTFDTVEGRYTDDGGVKWKCKPLTSRLKAGDTITVSTWAGGAGITLTTPAIIGDTTVTKVTAIPAGATNITITNTITILRANGRTEKFDKSLIILTTNL